MKLVVDVGNSRIKWALARANALSHAGVIAHAQEAFIHTLRDHWSQLKRPDAVLISSVTCAELNERISAVVVELWSLQAVFLQSERRFLALKNGYTQHQQLGVDRWLAMIAAIHACDPPLCVIDFGSAITFDVIDRQQQHLGGYIIPGRYAAGDLLPETASSLAACTANKSTTAKFPTALGKSTQECLMQGYTIAITAFIRQAIAHARALTDRDLKVIVTGGGAAAIMPLLSIDCIYHKDLVLSGMAYLGEAR